jgi:hypothetical protein
MARTGPASSKRQRTMTAPKLRRQQAFRVPRGVGKIQTGFPKQLRMKLRYCFSARLTTGLGTPARYQFSCNGLFDPDITGTGHQPMLFDQTMAMYNHYTVLNSKARFTFQPASAIFNSIAGYIEDDTSTTPANVLAAAEQSTGKYLILGATADFTNNHMTLEWDAKQAFGGDILDNDNLQGTSAANPTEQQYFTIVLQDPEFAAVTATVFTVVIEYDTIFEELKNLDSS